MTQPNQILGPKEQGKCDADETFEKYVRGKLSLPKPIRIQRKRTKGYDMQAVSRAINGLDCVYVGRPSRFGNPYSYKGKDREVSERVVELYRSWINDLKFSNPLAHVLMETSIKELRGKNLSCFCALDRPCHADVLLELAN